jgi:CheY-like chemotaxis protein/anti-sigma regulatory factor (Ser/Thr protein kinase)
MVVESFLPVAQGKGLTIETDLTAGAGPLRVDPERLQQVVWNLLSNSIRFTAPGGRILVRCSRQGQEVELSVRDSGRGISADALPRLFERYWQGSGPHPRRQGLGLGLAIAHRIVELHSGRIEAVSDGEGLGSTFKVHLPIVDPAREIDVTPDRASADFETGSGANNRIIDAVTAATAREPAAGASSLEVLEALDSAAVMGNGWHERLRILLVEDHDSIAKACQRLLASHGHSVVRASGITGALAAANRGAFDLLICDLTLADGSGLELLPRMQSSVDRDGGNDVPAIAMSGSVYEEDIARCIAAGFTTHLAKPFDEQALLAAIARVRRPLPGVVGTAEASGGVRSPAPAQLR